MLRRRDRARRAGRGVRFSPYVSQAAARRRLTWPRLALTILLLVAVVGGSAVVVASANDTVAPSTGLRVQANRVRPMALPRVRAFHPPAPTFDSANQMINRVLAYTPFVRAGIPRQRMIALTFDDGPSPYTPQVVRVLERMHAPATFFIIGQQLRYFSAGLRDEIRGGFVIGDHTENHPPLNVLSEPLQYLQIERVAARLARFGAPAPRLFRPPYGFYNANTFAILRQLHMLMVMWSVDPRDWLRPGTAAIVKRVLQGASPGTIIELHDGGGDRSETVAALPQIITALRRRHYQLVTVPELLAADPPPHGQSLPPLSE